MKKTSNSSVSLYELMQSIGKSARAAASFLAESSADTRNRALVQAANHISGSKTAILAANAKDMAYGKAQGLDAALLDRLMLDDKRIDAMAQGLKDIAALRDPLGKTLARWDRPNGLDISRVSVPLGVIGIIYESRPNVTADAGGLCIKSGNAAVLRGGSESFHSSLAIMTCLQAGLKAAGLPETAIQFIPTQDRAAVGEMLTLSDYIDVIIPRGGRGLIKRVIDESRIPTLQHLDGNCHTYVHARADAQKAVAITVNAKLRRTGVCGSTETLVIDEFIAPSLLPQIANALLAKGCELRGDVKACSLVPQMKRATEADWDTEYLAPILAVKIVTGLDEAVAFINKHGSHHTDAIITEDNAAAETFLRRIDSAIVVHNASTQFADGGEFGMGAEIGIATGRLHARGPVGVEQLTTYKYQLRGNGQTRP